MPATFRLHGWLTIADPQKQRNVKTHIRAPSEKASAFANVLLAHEAPGFHRCAFTIL